MSYNNQLQGLTQFCQITLAESDFFCLSLTNTNGDQTLTYLIWIAS